MDMVTTTSTYQDIETQMQLEPLLNAFVEVESWMPSLVKARMYLQMPRLFVSIVPIRRGLHNTKTLSELEESSETAKKACSRK